VDGTPRRLPGNAPGKYYVTEDCDGCAYCAAVAPENFEFDKSTNTYFVSKQPANPQELELVTEAKDDCPVDAVQVEETNGT
jgi:ferredoxin